MKQSLALHILKTGTNVFLTGEPGSGKTHTVNAYIDWLREHDIDPSITASTGIAATHVGGMTIHSWSGIGIKDKLSKHEIKKIAEKQQIERRIRRSKVLIVDEVSMLAPGVLDMVDAVCRAVKQNDFPFGGLQTVLVGDFFQLPPVLKREIEATQARAVLLDTPALRFAYGSQAWKALGPKICYLSEQYRQDDASYLSVLSAVRAHVFGPEHLRHIQSRKIVQSQAPKDVPKLFSHNADVDRMNDKMLSTLPGLAQIYAMSSHGSEHAVEALKRGCISPERLALKINASVMFTKNNPSAGFSNGTLGTVEAFHKETRLPLVRSRDGRLIEVEPMDWNLEENGRLRASITQVPLRLAWAITVHKSQGMSLDEAVMDLSQVFEYGQGYVALSRVRRLSGLHILGWNDQTFEVHPDVLDQDRIFRADSEKTEGNYARMSKDEAEELTKHFIIRCGGIMRNLRKESDMGQGLSPKKAETNTQEKTLELWNEGLSVEEIAKARNLKPGTILSHVEILVLKGKIDRTRLENLLTPSISRGLDEIHAAFRECDTDKLSPVFQHFNGAYTYDELRMARMLLL
ncbi:MAG: helix-turn-helix domain-containing protein [Candidatus Magasanikbacteria bacterium]|nr:helix-turn-helix domain-containing protein [Candidatus Magasanikbacteria bacterium]